MRTLAALVLLPLALSGCSGLEGAGGGGAHSSAACAAVIVYDGHRYWGHGELTRVPQTTGRTDTGIRPGCDDTGGSEDPGEADQAVTVEELADLPLSQAFIAGESFYVRHRERLPAEAVPWFEPVTCDGSGPLTVSGQWVAVQSSRKVRFDGDIRPPYRITLWVADGPASYVGTKVEVRADERTDPQLGPEDVKRSLWQGGDVTADVHCEAGAFVADGLSTRG